MSILSFKRLIALSAFTLIFTASAISSPLMAKTLDDEDKTEVRKIIKDYLMENPEIIREALQELERRTAEEEKKRQKKLVADNRELLVDPKYSYVTGNKDGDVTVIEFFDYNCPYCRQSLNDMVKLMEEDKNVKIVFKEYPILGEASRKASLAALAARKQNKYMEYHTALLSAKGRITDDNILSIAKSTGLDVEQLQKDMDSDEIKETLKKNIEAGVKLGINGTPTFIINDEVIPQVVPYEAMKNFIASLRKAG